MNFSGNTLDVYYIVPDLSVFDRDEFGFSLQSNQEGFAVDAFLHAVKELGLVAIPSEEFMYQATISQIRKLIEEYGVEPEVYEDPYLTEKIEDVYSLI